MVKDRTPIHGGLDERSFRATSVDEDTIGGRIRAARISRNMTQDELARAVGGVGRSGAAQWERNAAVPAVGTISRIAQILLVKPEFIAFGVTPQQLHVVQAVPAPAPKPNYVATGSYDVPVTFSPNPRDVIMLVHPAVQVTTPQGTFDTRVDQELERA